MNQLSRIRSQFSVYKRSLLIEYAALSGIAILVAFISCRFDGKVGMVTALASFGFIVAVLCFVRIEIGFYITIAFGFLLGSLSRLTFDRFPLTSGILLLPCVLLAVVFSTGIKRKDFSWLPWNPFVFFYFTSIGYMLVEIFNPNMHSFLGWLSGFWQNISYTALLLLSAYILKDLNKIRFFFKFTIGAIFITALYGCIQQWFGLSSFDARWVYSNPHIIGLFSLPGGGFRKFSLFTDPANFGTFMAGGFVFTLILLINGIHRKEDKILLALMSLIMILGMSYSGTRTANVMIFAGLGLYILMTMYRLRTRILAVFAGIIFLIIMYAPIYSNVTLNRFRSAFYASDDPSMNVRLINRRMLQPYMHQHPFGGGVNTAGAGGAKYNPNHFLAGFPPDGAYFAMALQEGWIGLLLNCLFYFVVLFYCVHYFYKCRNREIKTYYAAMGSMLFSLFLGAYTQFTVTSVPQSLIFIPFLAIIIKLHTFDTPVLSKSNSQT